MIISIVKKTFPQVCGDGKSSLLELIKADPRARLLAHVLIRRWQKQLNKVPSRGELINLVEIGAHSRGTLFEDASELTSPQLASTMARVLKALPGFSFGRIDLRVPDSEKLRQGKNISIMEINGVSAESGHIYQPGTSLCKAWGVMCRQWSIAFTIAHYNVQHGAKVLPLLSILSKVREDSRRDALWF